MKFLPYQASCRVGCFLVKKTRGVTDFWIAQPAKLSTFLVRHHLSLTAGVLTGPYWRKKCTDLKKKNTGLKSQHNGLAFPHGFTNKKKTTTTSETKINHIIATINCNKQTCQLFSTCQAHCESRLLWFEVAINMLLVQWNISVKRFFFLTEILVIENSCGRSLKAPTFERKNKAESC